MIAVKQIIPSDSDTVNSGITFGGQAAEIVAWPVNPDGDPLTLIASINCSKIKRHLKNNSMPNEGVLYIFSTYSKSDYFLENITYSGDSSELESILSGYTKVMHSDGGVFQISPVESVPEVPTELKDRQVGEEDFPVFSLISASIPHGVIVPDALIEEYDFICQLYSSDFSEPFKDVFYLTDAVGYLFLKKNGSGEGLFFVQTG
ncbi:DUF1963 domain-containing protein [Pseudomonas sp. KK4]|uniref:DUF1963 domain-containing protein n=1 Tax=Pseudomonas sp. KK4 TaxID=1855729 RepID=UPI00097BD7B5|nr:DUF1963 domain-containing protein [Pseudomonas sp. KK4]